MQSRGVRKGSVPISSSDARANLRPPRIPDPTAATAIAYALALPEAVDAMRAVRRSPTSGEIVEVAAADPLNLVGIVTPGARVPA
jgi:hypothetical protein